ncbi:hemolysin family protein [Terriglobus tenax]|uniref:hemolysin family protein n=1 Tax=Terriglobus tenax TaxID=1111115 RepID=UPI0021E03F2F|nr:hemolysin family protein [Terriglobus tenax]
MNYWALSSLILLLVIQTLASYIDRVYSEMGKFLSRDFQENVDAWTRAVEPRMILGRDTLSLSASVLRQVTLAAIAVLFGAKLYSSFVLLPLLHHGPGLPDFVMTAVELVGIVILFDRLVPYLLFVRTRGLWIAYLRLPLVLVFLILLPITMFLSLLISIIALAEPEEQEEEENTSEGVDALLEAGEEEGILEESDRELVRSVVEFGDMVARSVMTPRPEMFCVPATMSLEEFTTVMLKEAYSRVPVYGESIDVITGIAFARDLLGIADADAGQATVASIQKPVAFVPETKKVNELLKEMQRAKQHMRIVVDEYGAVAGLITIEDLLEAIVGDIDDEHDVEEETNEPVGSAATGWSVPGRFEVSRLRELFQHEEDEDPVDLELPADVEATTVGGLVSELAGHIPHSGEVVEAGRLRLEVLSSTDRRVQRVMVQMATLANTADNQ